MWKVFRKVKMNDQSKNILYGGFEGTDEEICENKSSLGEFVMSTLQKSGDDILLVSVNFDFLYLSFIYIH